MTILARVFVMPKKAILDPQGKAVASSLHTLGYPEVADARLGKLIELRIDADDNQKASARVDEMCKRLLANDIIEDYRFELETAKSFELETAKSFELETAKSFEKETAKS